MIHNVLTIVDNFIVLVSRIINITFLFNIYCYLCNKNNEKVSKGKQLFEEMVVHSKEAMEHERRFTFSYRNGILANTWILENWQLYFPDKTFSERYDFTTGYGWITDITKNIFEEFIFILISLTCKIYIFIILFPRTRNIARAYCMIHNVLTIVDNFIVLS
jgi:F0F1-type ATP synthase membrane subunit a